MLMAQLVHATDRNLKACFPQWPPIVHARDARHERPLVGSVTVRSAPRGASDALMALSTDNRCCTWAHCGPSPRPKPSQRLRFLRERPRRSALGEPARELEGEGGNRGVRNFKAPRIFM